MEYKITFKEYSKALKRNKLMGIKCNDCQAITCPPKITCQECTGTNLEVTQLGGTGKIVTFSTMYVAPEGRQNEAPYTIVVVELDEGPWIMGNLCEMELAKIDMQLIGRKVKLGHKVFPGDKYSDGEVTRPLFSLVD